MGDRLACDTAEVEGLTTFGGNSAAAAAAPTGVAAGPPALLRELALAVLPLLLLAATSRLWRGRRTRGRTHEAHARRVPAANAGQKFLATPASPAARQLPQHPAAAAVGGGAAAHGAAPAAGGAASSSVLAAADAVVSLLLLPVSLAQALLGRGGGGAAPATPAAVGLSGQGTPGSGGRAYGLGWGEAESEEEEEEGGEGEESEQTKAALRRLQQSEEFRSYLKARGMSARDVSEAARRLRLYRRLRRMDPPAFRQLLSPGSLAQYQSRIPSRLVLAADYLLSTAAALAAAVALWHLGWGAAAALPLPAKAGAVVLVLWAAGRQCAAARPLAGPLFGLWHEELRWGHAAPAWRCAAAAAIEAAYVLGSAGVGALVSLGLRCLGARRQGVGELLAGVAVVQEVLVPLPSGDSEEGGGDQD